MEEEIEAVPVRGILTLEAVDGNIQVVRNEVQNKSHQSEPEPRPAPPRRDKQSASAEPREISEKMQPDPEELVQEVLELLKM
jgi:hypothetical protein